MNRLHYLIILIAVVLISAYAGWLLSIFKDDSQPQEKLVQHTPDYFMLDVDSTIMTKQGVPLYRLNAKRADHFPDDQSLLLTSPSLLYYREESKPWHVVSESGRVYEEGKRIYLDGEVRMKREAAPAQPPMQLTTRDMLVLMDKEYAETAEPAVITSGNSRLAGTGMEAYLKEGRLELLADGEGTYVISQ